MSYLELELFKRLILSRFKWHQSNPEVGWGPTIDSLIEELTNELTIVLTLEEIKEIKLFVNKGL